MVPYALLITIYCLKTYVCDEIPGEDIYPYLSLMYIMTGTTSCFGSLIASSYVVSHTGNCQFSESLQTTYKMYPLLVSYSTQIFESKRQYLKYPDTAYYSLIILELTVSIANPHLAYLDLIPGRLPKKTNCMSIVFTVEAPGYAYVKSSILSVTQTFYAIYSKFGFMNGGAPLFCKWPNTKEWYLHGVGSWFESHSSLNTLGYDGLDYLANKQFIEKFVEMIKT